VRARGGCVCAIELIHPCWPILPAADLGNLFRFAQTTYVVHQPRPVMPCTSSSALAPSTYSAGW
jgi:hypothetical protein